MSAPARVLVVDDDPDVCAVISQALQHEGYEVHCAGDALEAFTALMRQRVDLVRMDFVMPGKLHGHELARDLAALEVRVVMMSGAADADEKLATLGHPYLLKPFSIAQLHRVIADALTHRPAKTKSID